MMVPLVKSNYYWSVGLQLEAPVEMFGAIVYLLRQEMV
jgi:hypothetical protein